MAETAGTTRATRGARLNILLTVRVVVLAALLTVTYVPAGGFNWIFCVPLGLSSLAMLVALLEDPDRRARTFPVLLAVDLLALAGFVFLLRSRSADFYLVCLYVLLIGAAAPGLTLSLAAAAVAAAAQAVAAYAEQGSVGIGSKAFLLRTVFIAVSAVLLGILAREAERERTARAATGHDLSTRIADLSDFLNNVLQSIHTGVLGVDAAGRVTLCNRRAAEILGVRTEDLAGRPLRAAAWLEPLWRRLEPAGADAPPRDEVSLTRPDGRTVELGMGASPLAGAAGAPQGTILVFQDITPLKDYQRRLLQQERLAVAGRITGGVAHEFGNLIGGLRTHAEFALQDGRPEELREALEIVAQNIDRAFLIVRNLLSFSRPTPPRAKTCDVARLLAESMTLVERDFARQRIAVAREAGEGLAVSGDPSQLQQAFLNILINARQAMPGGGALRVVADRDGARVRVIFADTGPGIPPEIRERIFEPFFTTKTGEGGDPPGSGLGLAITRDIVAGHGGTLEVESEPGRGSTFTLSFPAVEAVPSS